MALAGSGAVFETKAPKGPPALFPINAMKKPFKYQSPPPDEKEKELIMMQRNLTALYRESPYYYSKPHTQEEDVERYSDTIKLKRSLDSYLHTTGRYNLLLPRQLRAEPLETANVVKGPTDDSFMDLESIMKEVGDLPLPTTSINDISAELSDLLMPIPGLDTPAASSNPKGKRARSDGDGDGKREKKKAKKADQQASAEEKSVAIDFSNLDKHKLLDLRTFCREKGITVRARTKQSHIDAIMAWQKNQPKPSVAKKVAKTKTSSNSNVEGPSKGKEKEEQKEKKKEEEEEEEGEKGDREKGVLDNLIMLEEQVAEDGNEEQRSSKTMEEEEEEFENDYNARYESENEEEGDEHDEPDEPTF